MKRELESLIQVSARAAGAWASLGREQAADSIDGMRPSFVTHRLACAISETEELLSVHGTLWPKERGWRETVRHFTTGQFDPRSQVARSAVEVAKEEMPEASLAKSSDAGDLFTFFCQLRRSIMYASSTPDDRGDLGESNGAISTAFETIALLDRSQKTVLQGALDGLIRNSFLYAPAKLSDGDSIGNRYAPLFRAVRLLQGQGETSMHIDKIREILADAKITPETCRRVEDLINNLHAVLADFDIERIREILADGGSLFPGVEDGGYIVVIPGRGRANCSPIVLAIAQGRDGRSRYGLPNVMREVRAHLIQCFEKAEVVILLTDRWDPDLMKESAPDFSAYVSRPSKSKVLIPLVSWKRQLTVYHWP